jgi:hypothetical protein
VTTQEPGLETHLAFIQTVIARQASNSFIIKGWSVTLCSAIAALGAQQQDWVYSLVLVIPALAFWHLDAYYLRQERFFRFLYDDARSARVDTYDMGTSGYRDRCKY